MRDALSSLDQLIAFKDGNITEEVKAWALNEIAKLDKKNAKRKATEGEIKAENKPIAEAILKALEGGSMISSTLAMTIGQTTQKTNGVAGEMVKLGMLTKFKVKVKNKGEQTAYELVATEEVANEGEGEGE
jgi:hypothetical protein